MVPAAGSITIQPRRRVVAIAVMVASAPAIALTVWLCRRALGVLGTLPDADTAELLTALSAAGCAAVTARLTLNLGLVALASALRPGTTAQRRSRAVALAVTPRWLRPAVGVLLATGVTAGAAACGEPSPPPRPAAATASLIPGLDVAPISAYVAAIPPDVGPTAIDVSRAPPGAALLPDPLWTALPAPGWVPSTPPPAPLLPAADAALVTSGVQHAGGPLPRAARTAEERVVVRRGDSLWSIAARHLGPGASDAEIAAQWPRWWHANRGVIGPDPDLVLPGTRLTPPLPADGDPVLEDSRADLLASE